jgi:hypothetical protein
MQAYCPWTVGAAALSLFSKKIRIYGALNCVVFRVAFQWCFEALTRVVVGFWIHNICNEKRLPKSFYRVGIDYLF